MAYSDKCNLKNTNNNTVVQAEVMDFKPQRSLTVSINRSIKVILQYKETNKIYVGNMAGMEFTSAGTNEIAQFNKGRR